MYKIKLTEVASKMLLGIESTARKQIIAKIDQLADEPLLLGKSLLGPLKEYRSVRAAGQRYRIIYKVIESNIVVIIVAVGIRKAGDRKDIYELMKKYIKTGILGKDG